MGQDKTPSIHERILGQVINIPFLSPPTSPSRLCGTTFLASISCLTTPRLAWQPTRQPTRPTSKAVTVNGGYYPHDAGVGLMT